jgi:hypothetical protein
LKGRWDKFELMMKSHELMVKEQVCLLEYTLICGQEKGTEKPVCDNEWLQL